MNNPRISVIIPVYNIEAYLEQSISSVINQTLKEIEIILIDDGSTDASGDICDSYAKKDSRICVIHGNNEGLSEARNKGIEIASAPYIMFVDGDDWVETDFCSCAYNAAEEKNADVILFSYRKIYDSGKSVEMSPGIAQGFIDERGALYFSSYYGSYIWLGLYRRDLFAGIRFPRGMLYEDVGTTYKLLHGGRRIYYLDKCLYNYRVIRKGSITASQREKRCYSQQKMYIGRACDLYAWGYNDLALRDAMAMLTRYGHRGPNQKPLIDMVRSAKGHAPKDFAMKQKIMFWVFRISPGIFDFMCKALKKR